MPKLNDTQLMLLAHAATRDTGSLYPLPDTLTDAARVGKAVAALTKLGMAEERVTTDLATASRTQDDQRFGVFITAAGCAAINVGTTEEGGVVEPGMPAAGPATAKQASKIEGVLTLLRREQGATLPELIETTDWLPHTTRAALTGLRKKGHTVTRSKRDEVTCYAITTPVVP